MKFINKYTFTIVMTYTTSATFSIIIIIIIIFIFINIIIIVIQFSNYTHVFIAKLHLDEEVDLVVQFFVDSGPWEIAVVGITRQVSVHYLSQHVNQWPEFWCLVRYALNVTCAVSRTS